MTRNAEPLTQADRIAAQLDRARLKQADPSLTPAQRKRARARTARLVQALEAERHRLRAIEADGWLR